VDEVESNCIRDILNDHPELTIVDKPESVPEGHDIIGFRLSTELDEIEGEDGDYEDREIAYDFHFILKTLGKWYHKPGARDIVEVDWDINADWPADINEYDRKITWFAREWPLKLRVS